jgi:hypothetical protein
MYKTNPNSVAFAGFQLCFHWVAFFINFTLLSGQALAGTEVTIKMEMMEVKEKKILAEAMEAVEAKEAMEEMQPVVTVQSLETRKDMQPRQAVK